MVYVHGIALDGVMEVGMLAALIEHLGKAFRLRLAVELGDDNGANIQMQVAQLVDEAQQVHIIG